MRVLPIETATKTAEKNKKFPKRSDIRKKRGFFDMPHCRTLFCGEGEELLLFRKCIVSTDLPPL